MELSRLPYAYDALEPILSERAMRLHHLKHHAGYVEKLNKTLEEAPALLTGAGGLYELLSNPSWIPRELRESVIDFGGGVWNHDFYWRCLSPSPMSYEASPRWFQAEVSKTFGGYSELRDALILAGVSHFGSGWVWLVSTTDKSGLRVYTTLNQNTPMMRGHTPLLCIDLWEHAYYPNYESDRKGFLTDIIDVCLDWGVIPRTRHELPKP